MTNYWHIKLKTSVTAGWDSKDEWVSCCRNEVYTVFDLFINGALLEIRCYSNVYLGWYSVD